MRKKMLFEQATSRRQFLQASAGLTAALYLTACGAAGTGSGNDLKAPPAEVDGNLDYYAPTGYVPDEILNAFEKEYGVKVKQTYFSTVDEMIQKLGAGAAYDVTFLPSNFFSRATEAGLLLPIDHSKMKNWKEVTPLFNDPPFEPNAEHLAGPYAMGGVGLAYRTDFIDDLTGSWDDLWRISPTLPGRSFIFDDVTVSMTMSLGRLGLPTDKPSEGELQEAADALIELRKTLGGFGSSNGEKISDGQALLSMNYTGTVFQVLREKRFADTLKFRFCKETLAFNSDCMVVPSSAKHPGTGLVFCDYLLRPDNMKKIVEFVGYPFATKTGMTAYSELVKSHPFLDYDEEIFSDPSVWLASLSGPELRSWNKQWTRVKASA